MIDPKELRIGNLLNVAGNYWEVDSIITNPFELYFKENPEYNHALNTEPIPLTEEWLLKFGFGQKEGSELFWIYNQYELIAGYADTYLFKVKGKTSSIRATSIRYVHQLQNLFFALTGKEL